MNYLEKTIIKELIKFKKEILIPFCEERNLEITFKNFVNYREGTNMFPDSINFISAKKVSPFLYCNSKSFMEFVNGLEPDFRVEFTNNLTKMEYMKVRNKTLRNKILLIAVKKILKEDYVGDKLIYE